MNRTKTNYNQKLDEILGKLHQQYEMQFGMHKQQFNNKKIKQALTSLTHELVEEVIKKPHILPKNAQHQESVKQGINFYYRQMRKRIDKLKEEK